MSGNSSEWELSKENVQPLREGRKIAALTSALQHNPTDSQHLKDQRNFFEQQIRIYEGDDPLEVWDSYIKWTEQNFPRGGKDGQLLELQQRCLTHFQNHEAYKNDSRFVHIWIKFANFSDDPLEIYRYMFDQSIGCGLAMLFEEWANFVERLGNNKKADSIYLEGISRGAQPLEELKSRHREFQMRVARGLVLQPQGEENDRLTGTEEEQRTVLGRLRADKKNRVGSTRTGAAKLGMPRPLASSVGVLPKQQSAGGVQVFQDENAPVGSTLQQTGEQKTLPVREKINRENEQAPGMWTKARAHQRKEIAAAAATPAKPTFLIHEDENTNQQTPTNAALVDSHVLSTRKAEKPGHMLDPIRNVTSRNERPMYCKEKVYCGTQEFSFEELRSLRYFEKKRRKKQEEEQRRLEEQLREMRLMRDQFQKDLQDMRAEHRQMMEMRQMQLSSSGSSSVQPSPMPLAGAGQYQNTPVFAAPQPNASSSASFNGGVPSASFSNGAPSAPSSASFNSGAPSASFNNGAPSASFNPSAPSSASFNGGAIPAPSSASFNSGAIPAPSSASFNSGAPSVPSSASFNSGAPSAPSSASFNSGAPSASFNSGAPSAPSSASFIGNVSSGPSGTPQLSAPSSASFSAPSANSSLRRQGASAGSGGGLQNSSLNSSHRTPVLNVLENSASSAGNTSKHSLTSASPTIHTKEAMQMIQGMYNATLDCEKIDPWNQEDTEMTEAVQQPTNFNPVMVFDETEQKAATPPGTGFQIFCDQNAPPQENRPPSGTIQKSGELPHSGGRKALQFKTAPPPVPAPAQEFTAEDDGMGEGIEGYPHYDVTLAAVGSQDSFAAAARSASTPFGLGRNDGARLPSLPLSSIKPKIVCGNSDEEMADAASVQTNDSVAQHTHNVQFRTFDQTQPTPKIDLSPIIEGSSEGSSAEYKSQAASTLGASSSTTTVKSSAAPTPGHASNASLTPNADLPPVNTHVIDTSHYVPAEGEERTEALLSMSVCIDPHNPFDEATIQNFLKRVKPPLEQREGYVECKQHVPSFSEQFINLGLEMYQLLRLIGEGANGKVYQADRFVNMDNSLDTMDIEPANQTSCVIKVQKGAGAWEFYICSELHDRLQKVGLAHMRPSIMEITDGYFYQNGSCLLSDFCPLGSLLNYVNRVKKQDNQEPVAAYLTIHLLRMMEALHRCRIIHGDIKPDNILITGLSVVGRGSSKEVLFGGGSQCLRLVDFGQAIDMSLYPAGTTFMAKVGTSGFQCIEMMTDQPWTYQTDMFGLAGSIHVLVFGQYMKVYCSQGQWHMTCSFQRKWRVDLWKKLFHQLLNIPDCDHQPDLGSLRQEFEDHFMANLAQDFHNIVSKLPSSFLR